MRSNKPNWLKLKIIKYMAILMGVCYLINPLQQQLNNVLHTIIHELTPPSSIFAHHTVHDTFKMHQSSDHYATDFNHQHEIIDFVNTVFEASNEDKKASDLDFIDVKCDQHVTSNSIRLSNLQVALQKKCFWSFKTTLINGYHRNLEEPPRNFYS